MINHIFKITSARDLKFGTCVCLGKAQRAQNNFPQNWRDLGRVSDPANFWHTIEHIFKTTWARDFEFGV